MKLQNLVAGAFASAVLFVSAFAASASPITYTEVATGTGTLDGIGFTNALVTITLVGNTSGATNCGTNCTANFGSASVTVSGVGSDTFTSSTHAFANQNLNAVGISTSLGDILNTSSSAFATYLIADAIGPSTGSSGINSGLVFSTSGGSFDLTSILNNQSTFTATISPSPVPLPSALPLFATGLGALGLLGWRRKRKAATVA
jgi:hypothetical protein